MKIRQSIETPKELGRFDTEKGNVAGLEPNRTYRAHHRNGFGEYLFSVFEWNPGSTCGMGFGSDLWVFFRTRSRVRRPSGPFRGLRIPHLEKAPCPVASGEWEKQPAQRLGYWINRRAEEPGRITLSQIQARH
jgi:hypothetical protein